MQIDVAIVLAAISAIVGGVSAVASMVSARAAARQVRLMVEEMEKRERPYIYGRFQGSSGAIVSFILENKGSVAAINVKARFEEPAPARFDGTSLNDAALFSNAIAFFPPGESYSLHVDLGKSLFEEMEKRERP